MSDAWKVRTCFWFSKGGEEAAEYYVSLLPDSFIETVSRPNEAGEALVIEFTLAGVPYMILNGGPEFEHTPAASVSVLTTGQDETDRLWDRLVSDGGEEGPCGWVTDRYGLSWQIVPDVVPRMMNADDKEAAARAHAAMLQMKKLEIDVLEAAFRGD